MDIIFQSYDFIMLGFLIDEEEFQVKPAINRISQVFETELGSQVPSVNVVETIPINDLTFELIIDPTPTPTNTPTVTPTNTNTPSITPTQTVTPTNTITPTNTVTPTNSITPTITPTNTITPTQTVTPTNTITPTQTVTPTNTITPTQTVTPTNTITPTQTVTPTNTITPTQTITPTNTITPTQTPTVTPSTTPIPSLLLDLYPNAAAAYSLRKLRSAYTGSAIRVRASTSGAEGDVSFDDNNTISASSTVTVTAVGTSGLSIGQQVTFSTFWNAGGSNQNVFVTTWYDQSGNARDAAQTTQANQPQIVSSGIVITLNNKSSIEYTSSVNMNLSVPNSTSLFNFLHNGTSSNLIHVGSVGGISTTRVIIRNALGSATVGFFIYRDVGDKIATQINYGVSGSANTLNISLNNSYLLNKQNLLFTSFDADNATASNRSIMYVDNGNAINLNSALNPTSTANSTNNLIIGDGLFGNFVGKYQEIIIYDNDNNSNRSGISTNINTHYGIY
jgi:hypothetical protein